MRFTLAHEADFSSSEVISPTEVSGVVNYEHRRSRVLMDLAHHQDIMLERIKAVLPQVLRKLGMEEFSIAGVEAQITASNDGDFFHFHSDNSSQPVASRHLTFVYFFHREPRQFEGGGCGFTMRAWKAEFTPAREATRQSFHSRIRLFSSPANCCMRSLR